MPTAPVFEIDGLKVAYDTPDGTVEAVRGVSLAVRPGVCLGVVGESGSGKSQTFLAALGLLSAGARVEGAARFEGQELLGRSARELNSIRGAKVAMIFQDPLTALTPHLRIGEQIAEPLIAHLGLSRKDAGAQAVAWLERVGIDDPARRARQYPHELSGGMRQRVMIASAMACGPQVLIADEPTTALDVTVQAQILELMARLKDETGCALVLITHDMGVVARLADEVAVMRAGEVVEHGDVQTLFRAPATAYARDLIEASPRVDREGRGGRPEIAPVAADAPEVVAAEGLSVSFPVASGLFAPRRVRQAVDGVGLRIRRGETLGVVGESGSGKSSLARAVLALLPRDAGAVTLLGRPLDPRDRRALREARRDLQVVFQDPLASLDPRMTVGASIAEPLEVFRPGLDRAARETEVLAMMARVGLSSTLINRYPHELSGGQNQRVGIARAMILKPALVICDEATSALDVSVRAQVLDLLIELQEALGLAMMFISHDLAVVREISHRVLVLYRGRVVEAGTREALFAAPRHPYTRALLAAAPLPDPTAERGRSRAEPWAGEVGELRELTPAHWVAEH